MQSVNTAAMPTSGPEDRPIQQRAGREGRTKRSRTVGLGGAGRLAGLVALATSLALGGCAASGSAGEPGQGREGKDAGAVKRLATDRIYPAIGPYSQMVAHKGTLYVSGVLPLNRDGTAIVGTSIEDQTRLVLQHIGEKLRSQGLDYDDVLMATVYMKDLDQFAAMNRVYAEFLGKNPPARATVQVARIPRDAMIEIAVIAGRR